MTCAPVQDDLKAYVDDELPLLGRLAVRRHLSVCAPCRAEVEQLRSLQTELRAADNAQDGLTLALRERILTQVADVTPLPARRSPPRRLQFGLAVSLGANCLLLFLLNRSSIVPAFRPVPPVPASAPQLTASPIPPEPSQPRPQGPVILPKSAALNAPSGPGRLMPKPIRVGPKSPVASIIPSSPASVMVRPAAQPRAALPTPVLPGTASPLPPRDTAHLQAAPVIGGTTLRAAQKTDAADDAAVPHSDALVSAPAPASSSAAPAAVTPPPRSVPAVPSDEAFPGAAGSLSPAPRGSETGRATPTALNTWSDIALSTDALTRALVAKTVDADWQVDEQGRASDIRFTSTNNSGLDASIREAIRRNHYLPALKNGKPLAARMSHTFVIKP